MKGYEIGQFSYHFEEIVLNNTEDEEDKNSDDSTGSILSDEDKE